ncbi:MAG: hypothetical protein ND895_16715 [Pyrinomonadaceae bacterium]|nr:hypothetical protein [Pyrinomonadaceae bacterium]
MRSPLIICLCVLLFSSGLAQVNSTLALQPTKLEAFAGQPTARVTWSKEVGRIESAATRLVATALVVKDDLRPPHRMSGIRIELTSQNATDLVYLEDAELEVMKKALEGIESGIEYFRTERADAPLRYLGACELRQPRPTIHALSAAYYIAPDSSGLSLSAFKGHEFRFPNHKPSELAQVIRRVMDELKRH